MTEEDHTEGTEGQVPEVSEASLPDYRFYQRHGDDDTPTVRGHRPRMDRRCKVCRLVNDLQVERGYSFEEAAEVEENLYRFIHTFWDATDISAWLERSHGHFISHDSLSNHIASHIPDPNIAALDRIKSYRPSYMNHRFMQSVAETMRALLIQFREDLVLGRVEVKPADFAKIAMLYKEWSEDLSGLADRDIMNAISRALDDTITDPDDAELFRKNLRKHLEEMENK